MQSVVSKEQLTRLIDERLKAVIPQYVGFVAHKTTDTPGDAYNPVNRHYVTANGSVAGRPVSSVAVVGQFYLSTDIGIPMWYTTGGWRNGVGSIVAQA